MLCSFRGVWFFLARSRMGLGVLLQDFFLADFLCLWGAAQIQDASIRAYRQVNEASRLLPYDTYRVPLFVCILFLHRQVGKAPYKGKSQLIVGIDIHPHYISGTEFSRDNFPADGGFYQLLDRPAQGPSSKVRITALMRDAPFHGFGDFQGYALSGGQPPNPVEEEVGYLPKLFVSQGVEDDDLVHPVQELRPEDLPELSHQDGVGLLYLVQEDHGVWAAPQGFSELAPLVVTYVAWRGAH